MIITVASLTRYLKECEKFVKTNSSDDHVGRSFILSTRHTLQKFDKIKSSITGVNSSVAQWAFNSSEYPILSGFGDIGDMLSTTMFNQKLLNDLNQFISSIESWVGNDKRTDSETYKLCQSMYSSALMIFTMLCMSLQVNNQSLAMYETNELRTMLRNYKQYASESEDRLPSNNNWSSRFDSLSSSREFKSLLVFTKALRTPV